MIGVALCSSITEQPSILQCLNLSPAVTSSKAFQLLSLSELVVRTDDNHLLTSYDDLLIDHSLCSFRVPIHPFNKLLHQFARPAGMLSLFPYLQRPATLVFPRSYTNNYVTFKRAVCTTVLNFTNTTYINARFQVLTSVTGDYCLLGYCAVYSGRLLMLRRCFLPPLSRRRTIRTQLTQRLDDGSRKHLWSVGRLLQDHTAQHPKGQPSLMCLQLSFICRKSSRLLHSVNQLTYL